MDPRSPVAVAAQVVAPERGLNERSEVLDVRAHHDDVPGFEGRVVFEEMEDGVAQHLDLASAPVTGMHPHAVVGLIEERTVVGAAGADPRGRPVETDVVLQAAEQRHRPFNLVATRAICRARIVVRRVSIRRRSTQHQLHLPRIASPRRQQWVLRRRRRGVLIAQH